MKNKSKPDQTSSKRRKAIVKISVVGGIAATSSIIPKTWTKPIVESVVLPAHAGTSGCSADQGCYNVTEIDGSSAGGSIFWPGGTGPQNVDIFFLNNVCGDTPDLIAPGVVAQNRTEAENLLSCTGGSFTGRILELTTDPRIPNCKFYTCEVDVDV